MVGCPAGDRACDEPSVTPRLSGSIENVQLRAVLLQ